MSFVTLPGVFVEPCLVVFLTTLVVVVSGDDFVDDLIEVCCDVLTVVCPSVVDPVDDFEVVSDTVLEEGLSLLVLDFLFLLLLLDFLLLRFLLPFGGFDAVGVFDAGLLSACLMSFVGDAASVPEDVLVFFGVVDFDSAIFLSEGDITSLVTTT